ncbi:hypothetical protein ACIRPP_22580 [Streptomyces sp. NPDC101219]|uniref:hypothetical protein n=1 Tax=Streptomyces sp. NPDC101219 TaxID=3366131 RepID=UPI0037F6D582
MTITTTNYSGGETLIPLVTRLVDGSRARAEQPEPPTAEPGAPATDTVIVAIGRCPSLTAEAGVEYWSTPDMTNYSYECVYDPKRVRLDQAEAWLRTQLAERGITVAEFLNEDDKPEPNSFDLAKVIAAMPAAVDEAMRKTLPGYYSPDKAAEIAQVAIEMLRSGQAPAEQPLTAADRGRAWQIKYLCAMPDCGLDHAGADGEPGWHATTPIETTVRDIDTDNLGNENEPFLAAQIVVHDYRAQAYGRTTEMWLHYGVHTGALAPSAARDVAVEGIAFFERLLALCDRADVIARGDFEGDPEVARCDREAEDARIREITARREQRTADAVAVVRERQATAEGPLAEVMGAMTDLIAKTGDPDGVAGFVRDHLAALKRAEA